MKLHISGEGERGEKNECSEKGNLGQLSKKLKTLENCLKHMKSQLKQTFYAAVQTPETENLRVLVLKECNYFRKNEIVVEMLSRNPTSVAVITFQRIKFQFHAKKEMFYQKNKAYVQR